METKELYEFGPFRADALRKSLTRNGQPVPLPPKAFDVLYALLQKAGKTVIKDELMKLVWPDTFVEEGNLAQMVSLLRKALGESEGAQSLIVTVPRQGYRFVGDLTAAPNDLGPSTAMVNRQDPASRVMTASRGLWWIGATIAVLSGFGGWLVGRYHRSESPAEARVVRFTVAPPENTSYTVARVSPDGRSLALMTVDAFGKARLWVRRLDTLAAQPLAAAEFWPFWSPESRYIAFAQDGKLKRIEASGGSPQTICDAALVIGGSWGRGGTIIFSNGDVIYRVPADGGEAKTLTKLDRSRGETTHHFPVFLPNGNHFLYTIHSRKKGIGGIYVGSLDSPDARIHLLGDVSNAEYAPGSSPDTGHLLFVRSGALMAQRFSARSLQLSGEAFPVVESIAQNPDNLIASFSASKYVLVVTSAYPADQITWFDRTGKRLGAVGRPSLHVSSQLSPDEHTVAADNTVTGRSSSPRSEQFFSH
jgi:DNA-binding winged helix-turn-helix (wHTH) protein